MTTAGQSMTSLPEDDVVGILLAQHARIRDLFEHVKSAEGEHKQQTFDELRVLLAAHETAEEMVVRPVATKTAGKEETDARNQEENEANHVLAELEKLGTADPKFDQMFAEFQKAVDSHATAEETQEFPSVAEKCDETERVRMGKALKAAEAIAPTHPHPSTAGSPVAQWAVGPIASLVDRVKDAVKGAMG
jgi:hemerythrin superfamily protein